MTKTIQYFYLLLVCTHFASAASFVSTKDGDWNDPNTWIPNQVPGSEGDSILISHNLTLTGGYVLLENTILFIEEEKSLSVTGSFSVDGEIYSEGLLKTETFLINSSGLFSNSGNLEANTMTVSGKYYSGCGSINKYVNLTILAEGYFAHAGVDLVTSNFVNQGQWHGGLGYLQVLQSFESPGSVEEASLICVPSNDQPTTTDKFEDFIIACNVKYTTTAGNFSNQSIWSDGTSPVIGTHTVLINHRVTLDDDFEIASGLALVVNQCAELIVPNGENQTIENSGVFVNAGTTAGDLNYESTLNGIGLNEGSMQAHSIELEGGDFVNNNMLEILTHFTNDGHLTNTDLIVMADLTNGNIDAQLDTLINTACAQIRITGDFTNQAYLRNNGRIEVNKENAGTDGNFNNSLLGYVLSTGGSVTTEGNITNNSSVTPSTNMTICAGGGSGSIDMNSSNVWTVDCSNSSQFTLVNKANIDTLDLCAPHVIDLKIDDLTNLDFLWDNGSTKDTLVITESGNYGVTITNQRGCKSYFNAYFEVLPDERITIDTTLCIGDSLKVNNRYVYVSGDYIDSSKSNTSAFCKKYTLYKTTFSPLPNANFMRTNHGCGIAQVEAEDLSNIIEWSNGTFGPRVELEASMTITMIAKDANSGCTDSSSKTIDVFPIPEISFDGNFDTPQCDSLQLSALVSGNSNPQFVWSENSGVVSSSIMVFENKEYKASYTTSDGCEVTDSITISNLFETPVIDEINPAYEECGRFNLNEDAIGDYKWIDASSNESIGNNPSIELGESGTYILEINNEGCSERFTFTVTVHPIPALITEDQSLCGNGILQLEATGGDSYTWSPSDILSNASSSSPEATITKTEKILVTIESSNCGSLTDSVVVDHFLIPDLTLSGNDSIQLGEEVSLSVEGATTYQWSPSASLNDATSSEPIATPIETTTYTVTATGEGSCTATGTLTIFVNDDSEYFLPNTFTPNDDGMNDILLFRGNGIESFELNIYNRWGNLIFTSTDHDQGWDGTYKGQEQPSETYIYELKVVTLGGNELNESGEIQLVR